MTFAIEFLLLALNKLYETLITNDKRYWMKKKSTNISSYFNSIVYVLSHAATMQLFWSQLKQMMCCHVF